MESSSSNRFSTDHARPRYHFLPPHNWMNDPNGLIQWRGRYHLFYQHNPLGPLWGNMHWGHAVSDDLLHWEHLPFALAPTPDSPDEAGCFSGCAVDHDGIPTIIYTGTRGDRCEIQTQCLATSDDELITWTKYAHNPILAEIPAEAKQTQDFRDPFVWKEGDTWYMVVASRVKDVGGVIFLYRSANLIDWEYLQPLLADDGSTGVIWECANFFPLGEQWVLIVSGHTGTDTDIVHYFVGEYADHHFTPIRHGVLDYGCLYAPLTFTDDQNRRLLFGWMRETRSDDAIQRAGWAGVQSIPRELTLDDQNRLLMCPVTELTQLRGQHQHLEAVDVAQPSTLSVSSAALDIIAEFEFETLAEGYSDLALATASTEDGLRIRYDVHAQRIVVSDLTAAPDATAELRRTAPHPLIEGETLKLRVLVDASVIEIIANDRTSLSIRFYPESPINRVQLSGEKACLNALDVWEIQPTH